MNLSRISSRGLKLTKLRQRQLPSCCTAAVQGQAKQLSQLELLPDKNPKPTMLLPAVNFHRNHCGCGRSLSKASLSSPHRTMYVALQGVLSMSPSLVQQLATRPPHLLSRLIITGVDVSGKRCFHTGEGMEGRARAPQEKSSNNVSATQKQQTTKGSSGKERKNDKNEEDEKEAVRELDETELRSLCARIMLQAVEKDVMVRSVPPPALEKLAKELNRDWGWSSSSIHALLTSHPSLLLPQHRHALLSSMQLLQSLGFSSSQVFSVVEQLPDIVQTSKGQVTQAFNTLRQLGFGEDTLFVLLCRNPALLLSSPSFLSGRVENLKELFKMADVITLGISCPPVLTDPWKDVQAKFDYVFHEIGVTQRQMVHAALFNHSLFHLQCRHSFLVRAGLYSLSRGKPGDKKTNAPLDRVLGPSSPWFQGDDYRTFCALYEKEQAMLRRMQDSDSDEDSED